MATIAVVEPQDDVQALLRKFKLDSPTSLIRMMIQESNCFLVVERGLAMQNVMQERALASSGQLQSGSNVGGGQLRAADFLLTPTVLFSENNAGGIGAIAGAFGPVGALAAGGLKFKEAETTMTIVDARSGLQITATKGHAKKTNWALGGVGAGGSSLGAVGAYSNTNEGKVVAAAFVDSYNQVVVRVRGDTSLNRGVEPLKQEAAKKPDAGLAINEGDVLVPKIAGIKLLAAPKDSAKVVQTLQKTDEIIYLGKEQDGFLSVQSATVVGWVKKLMVTRH